MAVKASVQDKRGIDKDIILVSSVPINRNVTMSRSSIYYRSRDRNPNRRSRISPEIEERILNTAENRTTYGYIRIWAILRNSGTSVNIKAVRRII